MMLAAVLLGLAALGGMGLAMLRMRGGNPPIALAMLHGAVAAAGLVALGVSVAAGARGAPVVALVLFGVAALLGLALFGHHVTSRLIPVPLVWLHGLTAASGYATLLAHLLS